MDDVMNKTLFAKNYYEDRLKEEQKHIKLIKDRIEEDKKIEMTNK